jgi:CO dehydrogenase nickel-insertion accessory protein CooC1
MTMLPSEPKIFHGRDKELSDILKLFGPDAPRIAILGAGGIGKTSLAKVIVHHPDIAAKYEQHRHFVASDSATNQMELAALIGAHVGLKPANDLTRLVVHHFSGGPKSLLILDNLETSWEPTESREKIEEFLSLLTDVEHLALIVSVECHCHGSCTHCMSDHNAWIRKTGKSPLDSTISAAAEPVGTGSNFKDIS